MKAVGTIGLSILVVAAMGAGLAVGGETEAASEAALPDKVYVRAKLNRTRLTRDQG